MDNFFFVVLLLLTVFAGCNSAENPDSAHKTEDVPLHESKWVLTELNGMAVVFSNREAEKPWLAIQVEESRVYGYGGCNNYHGAITIQDGNKLKFSEMASTKMYCNETMETEQQLFDAYLKVERFRIVDKMLELLDDQNRVLAVFRQKESE